MLTRCSLWSGLTPFSGLEWQFETLNSGCTIYIYIEFDSVTDSASLKHKERKKCIEGGGLERKKSMSEENRTEWEKSHSLLNVILC